MCMKGIRWELIIQDVRFKGAERGNTRAMPDSGFSAHFLPHPWRREHVPASEPTPWMVSNAECMVRIVPSSLLTTSPILSLTLFRSSRCASTAENWPVITSSVEAMACRSTALSPLVHLRLSLTSVVQKLFLEAAPRTSLQVLWECTRAAL